MEEKNTKILMPTIIAVVTLIALVVGATYAYFTVGTNNNFETRTIEASAGSVGVVTLVSNEDNLYLNVPAHFMMKDAIPEGEDEIWYSAVTDPDGLPSTIETFENYTAATFTLTGDGEYQCSADYDLNISGNMLDNIKTIEEEVSSIIELYSSVPEDDDNYYRFAYEMPDGAYVNYYPLNCGVNGDNCSDTINFKIGGSNGNSYELNLSAWLLNKKYIDQTALAGTSMTVNFDITDFSCTAIS